MPRRQQRGPPLGRALAFALFIGCVALLAWLERAAWLPASEEPASPAQTAFDRCFAERRADIARMQAEGLIDESRAQLFTERASAMCRAAGDVPEAPSLRR